MKRYGDSEPSFVSLPPNLFYFDEKVEISSGNGNEANFKLKKGELSMIKVTNLNKELVISFSLAVY